MKIRKAKWLKLLLIGTSVTAIGTIPLTITACSKKEAIVTPELKTSIKGIGGLDQFITTSSKASDVNQNLKKVLDMNKKSVITNWDSIPKNQQDSIVLNPTLSDWDENGFGNTLFSQWCTTNDPTLVTWRGMSDSPNPNEEIIFCSNSDLKEKLTNNIVNIAKNALYSNNNNKLTTGDVVSLADADIAISEYGDLLIGFNVSVNQSQERFKIWNKIEESQNMSTTSYVLSIPANAIKFTPKINLEVTYGKNKVISENISIEYKVNTSKEVKQTFKNTEKNIIILDEKTSTSEDKIGLWKTVTDAGILKALGWIDNENDLSSHTDGEAIDAKNLKINEVISDLGITGLTDEKLLGIEIEMDQRDVNHADYNGEYSILVSTLLPKEGNDSDLNLDFAMYEIVAKSESKNTFNSLEVKVPNAYIIDTELQSDEISKEETSAYYMTITHDFFETSFQMGFKKNSGANTINQLENNDKYADADEAIKANLSNSIIFNAFVEKIKQSSINKKINLFNGIEMTFGSNVWSKEQKTETITLNISLKKGFSFKKAFSLAINDSQNEQTRNITSYRYNTENKTSSVTFAITLDNCKQPRRKIRSSSSSVDNGAILRMYSKTVEEIANQISNHSSSVEVKTDEINQR